MNKFLNKIIEGKNVSLCSQLPDDYIDLTMTSPPYDNLRDYNKKVKGNEYNGYSFDFEPLARELYRVTKPGGVVVWVVGDGVIEGSESGSSFRQALFFKDCGFNLHDTMIYEKTSPSHADKSRYTQIFEFMFVFSKGKPKTINLIRDRKSRYAGKHNWGLPSFRLEDGSIKQESAPITISEYGTRFNIWRLKNSYGFNTKDLEAHKHPAIFPEEIPTGHILTWSEEGDIVLDPFVGSGTTAKMAKIHHRNYIGFDIDPEYVIMARERIEKHNFKDLGEFFND